MKSLLATLVAVPLMSLSSMSFASEPVLLTASEMDVVTAAGYYFEFNYVELYQGNASPILVGQFSLLNASLAGSAGNNTTNISSGNVAYVFQ